MKCTRCGTPGAILLVQVRCLNRRCPTWFDRGEFRRFERAFQGWLPHMNTLGGERFTFNGDTMRAIFDSLKDPEPLAW